MSSRTRIGWLMIGAFLCLITFSFKAEAEIDVSGSFTSDLAFHQYEQPDNSDTTKYAWGNTLRLNFKDFFGSTAKMEGSFDLFLLSGDYADVYLAVNPDEKGHTWQVLGTSLLPLFETRKLYLSLFYHDSTFTLGRQIINYGVGYLFSPIDCFSTVNLQDVGLSRMGSDIVRIQIPLGDLAGIEGVTTFNNSVSAIKVFGNLLDYDLSLTGIYKKPEEEVLVGLAFKGDFHIGVHGELVEHYRSNTETDYFEGMVGADYSFADGKLLVLAEYYYNNNPIDPDGLTPDELLALNRTFLGKRYLFYQVSYIFDEIRMLTLNEIYNTAERSWVGSAQFSYNVVQNTDLLFYARYYSGDLNGSDLENGLNTQYGMRVEVKF